MAPIAEGDCGAGMPLAPPGAPIPLRPLDGAEEEHEKVILEEDEKVIIEEIPRMDRLVLEPSKADLAAKTRKGDRVVLLPPGRPARLSGPDGDREADAIALGEEDLRSLAEQEAESVLPGELSSMLSGALLAEVARMCAVDPAAPFPTLAPRLAALLVDVLWAPLAGCVPNIIGGEQEARTKLQLFWRCAVALCMMPLSQLEMMTKRKRPFLNDLDEHLPPDGSSSEEARLRYIRLNLPIFAMVAKMPSELKPKAPPPAPSPVPAVASTSTATPPSQEAADGQQQSVSAGSGPPRLVANEGTETLADRLKAEGQRCGTTAAKHTYDAGYNKWEKFDVDRALREVDAPPPPKSEVVKLPPDPTLLAGAGDDPMEALDKAIRDMEAEEGRASSAVPDEKGEAPKPSGEQPSVAQGPHPEETVQAEGVQAQAEVVSPAAVAKEASKSEPISDLGDRHSSPEEVGDAAAESAVSSGPSVSGDPARKPLPSKGPQAEAPSADKSTSCSLTDQYKKWDTFDADAALAKDSDDDDLGTASRLGRSGASADDAEAVQGRGVARVAEPSASVGTSACNSTQRSLSENYNRWDKFDIDAALDAASDDEPTPSTGAPAVSRTATCDLAKNETQEAAAERATSSTPPKVRTKGSQSVVADTDSSSPVEVAQVGNVSAESTALSLSNDYRKWDDYDGYEVGDDIDDVDDDALCDLDALTGPEEEVDMIHSHWEKQYKEQKRLIPSIRRAKPKPKPKPRVEPPLPAGPVVERPCEYRPANDPGVAASRALNRDYSKWKEFDVDQACLDIDNEGTTTDGTAMRCSAGKGSAMLQTENYTKEKEEYELDQDIATNMDGLKKAIAQRFKDASGRKAEGNDHLREGRVKEARASYRDGLEIMDVNSQATVLMSDGLADKNRRLIADMYRNLAAADLAAGDFQAAKESCDRVLESGNKDGKLAQGEDDEKARYRRAIALSHLGRTEEAGKDVQKLAAIRGTDDAVVRRLQAEIARHASAA